MISKSPNQVGLPCSINTDASLGWAVYCYQSWGVLRPQCQGGQSILLRLEGYCCRGSDAARSNTSQRAKCGNCPRRSRITHVLAPASYAIGKPDRRKMNGVRLWQQFGLMASKEYAAVLYHNHNKGLSGRRKWIQATHLVALPPSSGPQVPRILLRTDPSDTNLALTGREPPSAANRAPVAIPASPATRPIPSSGRSVRPVENKAPSRPSSGKGNTRPPHKQPPPISRKGRSSDGSSKAPHSSRPYSCPARRIWNDWNWKDWKP